MELRGRVASSLYVVAVVALTVAAFGSRDADGGPAEVVLLVITLPALIPGLLVLYPAAATAWHLTNADDGGPMWPVTLTYVVVFTAIAVLDVVLARAALRHLATRRARRGSRPGQPAG
ncbi:hypothetical protein ACIB24_07775 [Spongisporangium articulatum]|uniref:Integral membrane protein n=1 Tax=Spongisporangium articulatum TaxID=3362603 RepID=A0ABW8AKQ9_9ACTN